MIRRLQNKVAESRRALTIVSLYGIVAWLLMGLFSHQQLWPSALLFVVSTYLMAELNNRYALLHTYSRMVSSSFIVLSMMLPMQFFDYKTSIFQLLIIAFFTFSFTTYQRHEMTGKTYAAFLMIGIASLFWMPIVYFLPFYWIIGAAFLLSMDFKNFFASLFGVLTPYWILLPAAILTDRMPEFTGHLAEILPGDDLTAIFSDPEQILEYEWDVDALMGYIPFALLVLIAIIGIVHYIRNSYQDKIQTRMYFNSFTLLAVVVLIALTMVIFLPFQTEAHEPYLIAILIAVASPLAGHFIMFTNTRLTNCSFVLLTMLAVLMMLISNQIILF